MNNCVYFTQFRFISLHHYILCANLKLIFVFNTGNIALGKTGGTEQSSTLELDNGREFNSSNGVDGDLTLDMGCVVTDGPGSSSFPPSWWTLDLGSQHSVHNVTIYARPVDCCE